MSKTSKELWAVLDSDGCVVWTRGGSSTSQRLMVYETENKARSSLKNNWIRQVHDTEKLQIKKIFQADVVEVK